MQLVGSRQESLGCPLAGDAEFGSALHTICSWASLHLKQWQNFVMVAKFLKDTMYLEGPDAAFAGVVHEFMTQFLG